MMRSRLNDEFRNIRYRRERSSVCFHIKHVWRQFLHATNKRFSSHSAIQFTGSYYIQTTSTTMRVLFIRNQTWFFISIYWKMFYLFGSDSTPHFECDSIWLQKIVLFVCLWMKIWISDGFRCGNGNSIKFNRENLLSRLARRLLNGINHEPLNMIWRNPWTWNSFSLLCNYLFGVSISDFANQLKANLQGWKISAFALKLFSKLKLNFCSIYQVLQLIKKIFKNMFAKRLKSRKQFSMEILNKKPKIDFVLWRTSRIQRSWIELKMYVLTLKFSSGSNPNKLEFFLSLWFQTFLHQSLIFVTS